ncbi:non-ribosomal peptide synthetase [[Flexibacter] sp. ATCC 35103]|uniref:non-ribosomal peptide synthetase n=1 Tax=[Flexibacter] sp. ATCC 35103 TaxID=1937528 RepID=UPI0009C30314|nr:non-ribosomal peptide synthetase [[Flexibacter] sp. ATCC 35103]AQX14484.1 monobactam NRPS scaffold 2 [[Flexibacter] sp. ATCC 35103]OMQ08158.1 hypothetical protein BXU01_21915 [[Flexibacter] sp. ATCC 35103]
MSVSIKKILSDLRLKKIKLELENENIKIISYGEVIAPEILEIIKTHKKILVDYLKSIQSNRSMNESVIIPTAEILAHYPLSSSQKSLWFLSQRNPDSIAYNMPVEIELKGAYDFDCLKKSIQALVSRHEILRTVFKLNDSNEIRQWILPADQIKLDFNYIDFRTAAEKETKAKTYITEDLQKPYDFVTGPLFRGSFLQLEDDRSIFYINLHHIITDEWSMEVLSDELFQYYEYFKSGKTPELEDLRIQYKDYASWQQNELSKSDNKQSETYWYNRFSDDLPLFDFPKKNLRPKNKTYNGKRIITRIPVDLNNQLKKYAQSSGGSLFMTILGTLKVLLYRYTAQQDIIIGSPVTGRNYADLENQIGFYINVLPLRNQINAGDSFNEVFEKIKTSTLEAFKHQLYPFESLLEKLDIKRDTSRNPVFDILIDYHNFIKSSDTVAYEEIKIAGEGQVKYEIEFHIINFENEFDIEINFNRDIYDADFLIQFLKHYKKIVPQLLENPELKIGDIDFLSENEMSSLVNFSEEDNVSETAIQMFEAAAASNPDKVAIACETKSYTYAELNNLSNQFANCLKETQQLTAGNIAAILLDKNEWSVITILGVLKAGLVYIPIDTNYPSSRISAILKDSNADLLITDTNYIFEEYDYKGGVFAIDVEFEPSDYAADFCNDAILPTDLAYVIYTSGSTGTPKGVMITHYSLANYLQWGKSYYCNDATQTYDFGLFTSISFDLTITSLFLPLLVGSTLHIFDSKKEIAAILKDYFNTGISCIKLTPAHIDVIDKLEIEKSKISLAIVGGDALQKRHIDILRKLNPSMRIINEYGPTEATVGCIVYDIDDKNEHPVLIGLPIANTAIYIANSDNTLQPKGVVGEILISGAGLSSGYLNNPELTAAKFIDNPYKENTKVYKTGDLGRITENGQIEYLGRNDNQVKINGYRIELDEITQTILHFGKFEAAEVLCSENETGNKTLIAFVVNKKASKTSELKEYLAKKLPSYLVPEIYIEINEFPITINGKVDTKKLLQKAENQKRVAEHVIAKNENEEKLVALWERIIGIKHISTTDNFFAIGGDSIKAIQLVVEIKKEFNSELNVADIFEHQTIIDLSTQIEKNKGKNTTEEYLNIGYEKINQFRIAVENDINFKIDAYEYEDIYPLASIETGMIFSSQIRPEEPVYYDQYVYDLEINDENEFLENIEKLVQRHASLRTKYYTKRFNNLAKIVFKHVSVPVTFENILSLTDDEKRNRILEYGKNDLDLRLEFDGDLLWRVKVFRVSKNIYTLFFSFHHALLDGWSTTIFKTELSNIGHKELAPLKHSYKDYCAIAIAKKSAQNVIDYWKNALDGYTRNKLPFNFKGKKVSDKTGMSKLTRPISKEVLANLIQVSEELKISPKTICLAAHVYLMKVISAETDIITGIVTHERPEIEDSQNILGCFLNTIPVRINVSDFKDIKSLILYVNDYLRTVKSKEIHLTEIANVVGGKSSLENPFFDTLMNYTDFHEFENWNEQSNVQEINSKLFSKPIANHEMTNTLFDLEVDKTLGNLSVSIKYANAYFHENDCLKAAELYEIILEKFIENPDLPLSDLNMLTDGDKQLLDIFNDTIVPYSKDKKIHELFEEQVKKNPFCVALKQKGVEVTYDELNRKANQFARHLVEQGVKTGDHIGIITSRNFEMIIGLLGILKAGGVYIPIDSNYPLDRKTFVIENSAVSFVITEDEKNIEGIEHVKKVLIANYDYNADNLNIPVDSTQLAYTIYTSGSTGNPKGVKIPHHAAVNLIEWVNSAFNVQTGDKLLFITSVCFDLSVYDIFGMLASGGAIVIMQEEEIKDFKMLKKVITEEQITFWDSVPTTMNYLINELEYENENFIQTQLKTVFLSGDWIPTQLPTQIVKFFPNANVISLGGATEGTVWSNYYPIKEVDPKWSSIPYGKPIDNNFFYILDENQNHVPVGVAGELFIGGVGVANGYANDEVKSAGSFFKDPFNDALGGMMYKTGDLGQVLPEGNMEFLGRKDYQVKIRGFRVELGEIESVALKNDKIKEVIVDVMKEGFTNRLIFYVVFNEVLSQDEIKAYLRNYLPDYMIPEYYVTLDKLPLNTNGKIDRKLLPKPDLLFDNQKIKKSPEGKIQIKLEAILSVILNRESIATNENFFELGIDSLTVGSFVNRINSDTGYSVTIRDIFNSPTIELLAQEIEKINLVSVSNIKFDKELNRKTKKISL